MTMTGDQFGEEHHPSLTTLQEECYQLLQQKQFKSCEILAQMELAKAEQEGRDVRVAFALLGECAHHTQQYNRAISYYRKIQYSFSSGSSSHTYRLKEAQCLQSLGNVVEASSLLELIPRHERNLTMHMTLGNLYLASGRNANACECFLESLRLHPYALEAVEWLAVLGVEKQLVVEAVAGGLASRNNKKSSNTPLIPIQDLISAHFLKHRHQTATALQHFSKLERDFPNNVYLLLKIAVLQVRLLICFIFLKPSQTLTLPIEIFTITSLASNERRRWSRADFFQSEAS